MIPIHYILSLLRKLSKIKKYLSILSSYKGTSITDLLNDLTLRGAVGQY
ncbi:unnamed protein product [marine sediment metagenome]|uniref:Uncharacterized protein n=1 Tax=marine sediment metagenome TaxID=412755 RepID=X1MMF4_9ZZZZ